ncbi:MAG: ABC transporter ATP-binding protein [Candidatus Aenigmatarchaeota archaeon]
MKNIIELENVTKIYQLGLTQVVALNKINLKIKRNELVSIMGPSGSGKSTLLHLIGALDKPTYGKVYIDGIDLSNLTDDEMSKIRLEKIGFVFQFFNLYPTLTALENIELPMIIGERNKKERRKRAIELLESVGLKNKANHYPSQLSGGERQRVAIARALANDPPIILADEPTGNLDSKSGEEIIKLLSNLHENNEKTIVLVTHNKNIAKYSERIIYLKDGKIEV